MTHSIPAYHLRLNKAVDRFLLIDILRCFTKSELEKYWYIGLGGPFLEDFKLLETFFPTLNKISFEYEEQIFLRQKFNRPSQSIQLVRGNIVDVFDEHVAEDAPLVVWFDSTSQPSETIDQFVELLGKVPNNSIVRITTKIGRHDSNPHKALIASLSDSLRERIHASDICNEEQRRLEHDIDQIVREQIGNAHPQRDELERISRYLPIDYMQKVNEKNGMMKLLMGAIHQAAVDVLRPGGGRSFRLLNASHYSDGMKMLSVTGAVIAEAEEEMFMSRFSGTPFETAKWTDEPMQIDMPILTLKEQLCLNECLPLPSINEPGKELINRLGFSIELKKETCEHEMEMYNRFYRYYPVFAKVAL